MSVILCRICTSTLLLLRMEHLVTIAQAVWEGSLNLEIVYEDSVILLKVWRNGWLASHYDAIAEYFGLTTAIWLECEDVPIRWHLPTGVLFDATGNLLLRGSWILYVRTGDAYPERALPQLYTTPEGRVDYPRNLRALLMAAIKQSVYVLAGTSKPVMTLPSLDLDQLMLGIINHDREHYQKVLEKLDISKPRAIPIRMITNLDTLIVIQADPTLTLAQTTASVCEAGIVVCQGIEMPASSADMAMVDMWKLFKSPDNFLYMVVKN